MSFRWSARGPFVLLGGAALLLCFVVVAAPAYANGSAWAISSASSPTNFAPGDETGDDTYVIKAIDTRSWSAGDGPIEVSDALPAGLTATRISGEDLGNGQALSCSLTPTLGCTYAGYEVAPGDVLQVTVAVDVKSGAASPAVNSATVTDGGATAAATSTDPTTISSTPARFGVSGFASTWSGTQAGASANLTAGFTLNQVEANGEYQPAALAKDVEIKLPPGVFANAEAVPRCPTTEADEGSCEEQTAVGVVFASLDSNVGEPLTPDSSLLYNVAPATGEPAAFMFKLGGGLVRIEASLSAENDYRMSLRAESISEITGLLSMEMTLWGVPGAYNDSEAGPDHVLSEAGRDFGPPGAGGTARFLTSGGACEVPAPTSTLSVDSWPEPAISDESSSAAPPLTGCNRLPFASSLSVVPDSSEGNEPSGYEVDLHLPQQEGPAGLASAQLEEAAMTLPEGAGVSLSAADGLKACSEAQVGLGSSAPATCPEASKLGQVTLKMPLLANPLEGAVYLAAPNENPFSSLLALYIVADDPAEGVLIKLAGRVEANPITAQLTIVLHELPPLPISDLELHFFGGARALLTTPPGCGLATTTSDLKPWSGNEPSSASSSFEITSAANGTPCSEEPQFSPAFQAGSTTNEAGAYDSLTLLVTRAAQEEELSRIAVQTPQAVTEMFSGVQPCGEQQAAAGICAEASRIGSVQLAAGAGPDAYRFSGPAYLTGPYRGAQQGLSLVVAFNLGPLQLGTVIVRASEQIDPGTRQMTIESDPLPTVLDGIPLQLTEFALQLDRGEFRPSPDNCEPLTITGTLTSTEGSSAPIFASAFSPGAQETFTPCPAPQTVISPSPSAGISTATATVSLKSTHITTTSSGKAAVKLACKGAGTCRGKLSLTVKTKGKGKKSRTQRTTIGTAAFSIPAGKIATIEFELDARGRALLSAAHGHLSARLTALLPGLTSARLWTKTVQLTLEHDAHKSRK